MSELELGSHSEGLLGISMFCGVRISRVEIEKAVGWWGHASANHISANPVVGPHPLTHACGTLWDGMSGWNTVIGNNIYDDCAILLSLTSSTYPTFFLLNAVA